ncbi:hypothetical protein CTAYLR_006558 [Chrysophaeum taylorii]|uniref:cGMP-dependent protein kinase n=1 Tax=Chrysophaeum taylorii TaxID=2483200 RepID=A0AAD7UFL6_9STRA|nr:hypothetical protein CTAYLR_006558 [Chrysophaeum taylorii]
MKILLLFHIVDGLVFKSPPPPLSRPPSSTVVFQEKKEVSVGAKAAWFGAELFGRIAGGGPAETTSPSPPPQSVAEAIERVRADHAKSPPYFLSGKFDRSLYAEDCEFSDPFVSFRGRQRFETNLANLGGFITEASAKPLGETVTETSYKAKFAVRLRLALPWRPVLAWPWGVEHTFESTNNGVVVARHIESWDVSVAEGLRQLARPSSSSSSLGRADPVAGPLVRIARSVGILPASDPGNWTGEPLSWAENSSVPQRLSELTQSRFSGVKQLLADLVAGDYDEAAIDLRIDAFVASAPVAMFSFTGCPFCRKAKDKLDEIGAAYEVLELDLDPEGPAIRSRLGRRTGRTSVPAIWIAADYVGGLNDGNPGLLPLDSRERRKYYRVDHANPLGCGAFGAVYRARDTGTGETVALKKVGTDDGCVVRELSALPRVSVAGEHPNIACLVDAWVEGKTACVATELADGGELFDFLVAQGRFSEATAAGLFEGAVKALAWLHRIGVVHCDVKPENLVLTSWGEMKLIDFGSALVDGATPTPSEAMRCYGTCHYAPPELLASRYTSLDASRAATACADPKADAWALGVVLFVALVGAHPFDLEGNIDDPEALATSVLSAFDDDDDENSGIPAPLRAPGVKRLLSPAALDLLGSLLRRDPAKRASLDDALSHPWFNGAAGTSAALAMSERSAARSRRLKERFEASALERLVAKSSTMTSKKKNDAVATLVDRVLSYDIEAASREEEIAGIAAALDDDLTDAKTLARQQNLKELLGALRVDLWRDGDVVFAEGDEAGKDAAMFFISSGQVDVSRRGTKVATLEAGQFFGESGLVFRDGAERHATVTVRGDAKLVAVRRSDVQRLTVDARDADRTLRAVAFERAVENAKTAIAAATHATRERLDHGQWCCRQGDPGNAVFSIEAGSFDVVQGDTTLTRLHTGAFFGEAAVLSNAPRNATVVCASPDGCVVHRIAKHNFIQLLKRDPRTDTAVRSLLKDRRRTSDRLDALLQRRHADLSSSPSTP